MAVAVTRKTDKCTGHSTWPPRQSTSGSPDVFYNGLAAHRVNDTWAVHCNPQHSCHTGFLAAGSPTVFTNGRQQGRVNDPVNCGSFVSSGSPNIFIGSENSSDKITLLTGTSNQTTSNGSAPDGTPIGQDGSEGGTIPYYAAPGGGGGVATTSNSSGGPYVATVSIHGTSGDYNPTAPNTSVSNELGALSEKYESNGNPASICYDKVGGYSYGLYQISSNVGAMENFLEYEMINDPSAYNVLEMAGGNEGALTGSENFKTAWINLASNSQFVLDQKEFIQSVNYDPAVTNIKNKFGIDVNTRSLALQDVVWSTAVQNGPTSIFNAALAGKNITTMTDADIINAIYDERGRHTTSGSLVYFSKSTPAVQNSVVNRLASERSQALAMLN